MIFWLKKSASIQPRKSPLKFDDLDEKIRVRFEAEEIGMNDQAGPMAAGPMAAGPRTADPGQRGHGGPAPGRPGAAGAAGAPSAGPPGTGAAPGSRPLRR